MKKIFTLIFAAFVAVSANAQEVQGVDLGTGVLWGDRYVGVTDVKTVGKYYAYGDPTDKVDFTVDNYAYKDASFVTRSGDILNFNTPTPDVKDVATEVAGSQWRTPTYDELNDLMSKCTLTLEQAATSASGTAIIKITGPNGNSISVATTGNYEENKVYNQDCCLLTCTTLYKCSESEERYGYQYLYIKTLPSAQGHEGSIQGHSFVKEKDNLGTFGFCILPVSGEAAAIKNVTTDDQTSVRKFVQNGQLVIVKNGRTYNAAGALLK